MYLRPPNKGSSAETYQACNLNLNQRTCCLLQCKLRKALFEEQEAMARYSYVPLPEWLRHFLNLAACAADEQLRQF